MHAIPVSLHIRVSVIIHYMIFNQREKHTDLNRNDVYTIDGRGIGDIREENFFNKNFPCSDTSGFFFNFFSPDIDNRLVCIES